MRLLAEKVARLKIGWNERPLGECDIDQICEKFNISVSERPLLTNGFYYRAAGCDFIVINSRLPRLQRLEVFFHELAHFLFHAPARRVAVGFHHVGRRTRPEREADVFALCALIPRSQLAHPDQLAAEGFEAGALVERLEIYRSYGL